LAALSNIYSYCIIILFSNIFQNNDIIFDYFDVFWASEQCVFVLTVYV